MEVIPYILIGIVAGLVAAKILKASGFEWVSNLVIGSFGAILGGWAFGLLHFPSFRLPGSLLASLLGAILFLWIFSLFHQPHEIIKGEKSIHKKRK